MPALIPVMLSIGAIYALIPVIVIVILIAAAAGLRGVDNIFGMFGFAAIASFVGGKGAIGGGRVGKALGGSKYKAERKSLGKIAGKLGAKAGAAQREALIGTKGGIAAKTNSLLNPTGYGQPVAPGPTIDALTKQAQQGMFNKGKPEQTVRMAVGKNVIRRARAKVPLTGKLSLAQQTKLFVNRPKDIGLDILHGATLTSGAAAALENRMHPHMRTHNDVLNNARDAIYENRNADLATKFGAGSMSYRAASTFDNWSERIIGERFIGNSLKAAPYLGRIIGPPSSALKTNWMPASSLPPLSFPAVASTSTTEKDSYWSTFATTYKRFGAGFRGTPVAKG